MDLDDHPIEAPIPGARAFEREDEAARLSRAAIILCLGLQVGDRIRTPLAERFPGMIPPREQRDEEDWRLLNVPELAKELSQEPQRSILKRYEIEGDPSSAPARLAELAWDLEKGCEASAALALFEFGVRHPDPLTRVASAIAHRNWLPGPPLLSLLGELAGHDDRLVATLARDELARIAPGHPVLAPLAPPVERTRGAPSHTSLLVHGTWARFEKWWQPSGSFHTYMLQSHVPDLYTGNDRYEWSGAWSDHARAMAAVELGGWLAGRSIARLSRLFGHSHGANVAMAATHGTTSADQLVLLSCPVHTAKYLPEFGNVDDVVSFQVHMDLVVLADGGRLKFRRPGIRDETIPVWFKHDASHDEVVWDRYSLASRL